jgi:hypothetical protein
MVLSDTDMLGLVRTLPIPMPWDREAFVQGIGEMRGRAIALIATEREFFADRLCGMSLAREDDDVILYERDASQFRIDQVICHQIGHMVLGHHSSARPKVSEALVNSVRLRAVPDRAPESASTVLNSTDYGDEQEHEADLFALLLLMNATEREEHSKIRQAPSRPTASQSQQRARAWGPSPTVDADLALVRGYVRELKIACDDLRHQPFNPEARAHLMRVILHDSERADAANDRLHAGFTGRGQ